VLIAFSRFKLIKLAYAKISQNVGQRSDKLQQRLHYSTEVSTSRNDSSLLLMCFWLWH